MMLYLVEQSQYALGRNNIEEIRTSVTKYSLDLLNISSKFTPQQIIVALKKRPQGTLCFYGLPGTGKTQLAEYIATALDKPLMIKRASDLMSKWVGDNEKNIAKAAERLAWIIEFLKAQKNSSRSKDLIPVNLLNNRKYGSNKNKKIANAMK